MMKRFRALAVLVIWATLSTPAFAQPDTTGPLAPGVRIRVTARGGERTSGTLLLAWTDSVTIQSGDSTITVARRDVLKLEVSVGTRTHTLLGAGLGFIVGASAGWLLGGGQHAEGGGCACPVSLRLNRAQSGFVWGGLIGAWAGAKVGAPETDMWASREVGSLAWLKVLPRAKGVAVTLALRF